MLANHPNVLGGGATTSSSSGGTGLFADGTAAAPSISFANDSDTGFYSQTPNQIALAFGGQYRGYFGVTSNDFIVRSSVSDAQLTLGSAGNVAIQAALTNQNITLTPSGTGVVQIGSASGTLLLVGTSTNSNNGAIQLATHTSSAGGIGFGTEISLYRGGSSVLTLGSTGLSQFLFFQQNSTRSGYIQSAPTSLDLVCDTGEIKLKSNATTALTLDTSQKATFAGAIKLANAYVATPVVSTGYVTIQDSTGTTYKIAVSL